MALTEFQRTVCRLIARQRRESGESYVAGGTALNAATGAARISRDIDLFHDSAEAVHVCWQADRKLLEEAGYRLHVEREREGYVEALVSHAGESVVMQWAADSAFRYFPLVEHEDFGLALHPFDLATNKVLALVGRLEARDWVDVIHCHDRIQQLGYLAWAASGKDPGFSPAAILEQAARSARYSSAEIAALAFAGPAPDAADLSRKWHDMLDEARELVALLPPEETGKCVLGATREFFHGGPVQLRAALKDFEIAFHVGRIRGALPQPRENERR
ncbi:MAG: nucleotidyl transferase AbiEii/AbiGii toxin family protein [Candidatus Hydrogenedentes bacterium]|nr:nucleotidyl transferase AbiEii/AbiGii toxin family protein [Candidatus Hydrogenedentota bacterium]